MKVGIACDHRGFDLKQRVLADLEDPVDFGTYGKEPVDYPDYAEILGKALISGQIERGILICGSGVGVTVAANKIPGVRACLCHDLYSSHQGVEHDAMNVLVLGALVINEEQARALIQSFLQARFDGAARHIRRLDKIRALEEQFQTTLKEAS